MRVFTRGIIALALVGAFFAFASNALANTTRQQAAGVTGFCGPAFANKSQMIAWYRSHPARRAKAEKYVRAHAGYYHIQADQSFISWLTNPHLIIKRAPAGYVLISNTYCDAAGNVLPYHGKLSVGGVPLLWWCSVTSGGGHNCTPVAKYYCRNWVRGHKAFRKKRHHHKPPPPASPSYACVNLALSSNSIQTGQSVTATLTYTSAHGATFQSLSIDWGDSSTPATDTPASHVYNVANSYTVVGTVFFKLPNGKTRSSTAPACQKPLLVSPPPTPPVTITKVCENVTGDLEACSTGGTFSFQVTTAGVTTTWPLDSNPQDAGTCQVGDSVVITENAVSGWQILSANPQTFTCTADGVSAVFKNRQTPPPPAPNCWFNAVQELWTSDYSTNPPNLSQGPVTLNCEAPAGDVLSVTIHVIHGTLSTNTFIMTAVGTGHIVSQTVTYTAPSDPLTDMVTAHVVDTTTGQATGTPSVPDPSTPIQVVSPPPPPGAPRAPESVGLAPLWRE